MAKRDIIGQRFGRLLVDRFKGESGRDRAYVVCKCDCGNAKTVYIYNVLNGDTRSCGCLNNELTAKRTKGRRHHIDLTGERFGRLLVVAREGVTKNRNAKWLCRCDCGTAKAISAHSLRTMGIKSCGCLQREVACRTMTKHGRYKDRDYINELGDKRRAIKSGAFVERVFRQRVYERDMGLCQICGLPVEDDFTLDHRVPLILGGQHSYENCRTAHASCNFRKSTKRPEDCAHLWKRS